MKIASFHDLRGQTLTRVEKHGDSEIVFTTESGESYRLYHDQDCCESVYIESVVGNLDDLVGSPILMADEVPSGDTPPADPSDAEYGTFTWTFYKLATVKGYVDIRFYGSSNGYYSESVDFEKVA